jgi:ATP-dependent exoDNAse (exonuclease V) alpha subunit
LTAPHKAAGVANRELGTVERIDSSGNMKLRMDSDRTAVIPAGGPAHVDHGYAVTSHSAQGATADKVIVHAESGQSAALVNERFAYVAGSRMREDLEIYTDNSLRLTSSLERQFDKTAALIQRGEGDQHPSQQVGNRVDVTSSRETSLVNHASQSAHSDSRSHESGHGL